MKWSEQMKRFRRMKRMKKKKSAVQNDYTSQSVKNAVVELSHFCSAEFFFFLALLSDPFFLFCRSFLLREIKCKHEAYIRISIIVKILLDFNAVYFKFV